MKTLYPLWVQLYVGSTYQSSPFALSIHKGVHCLCGAQGRLSCEPAAPRYCHGWYASCYALGECHTLYVIDCMQWCSAPEANGICYSQDRTYVDVNGETVEYNPHTSHPMGLITRRWLDMVLLLHFTRRLACGIFCIAAAVTTAMTVRPNPHIANNHKTSNSKSKHQAK